MSDLALGHRTRLRERFLKGGEHALADYELLEILLFAAAPRGDVKPLAKQLIKEFGSFSKVLSADPHLLAKVPGMGVAAIAAVKATFLSAHKIFREEAQTRPLMNSFKKVLDYCQVAMEHLTIEQFRVLFLDRHHKLMAEEAMQSGTIDQAPVYPREIVKKALELGAAGVILVHNHPSGDPTPSQADLDITRKIVEACDKMGIHVLDHLIIGHGRHTSLKSEHLM